MTAICVDARLAGGGGIGTYLKNLLLPLKEASFKVKLLVQTKDLQQYPWLLQFECIPFPSPIFSVQEQFYFPLKIPSCDLFWSPHFNIPLFPIRAKRRLLTLCDMYHFAFFSSLSLKQKIYAKGVVNAAVRMADRVITISHFSKQEIAHYTHIPSEKISVSYLGVDTHLFHRAIPEEQAAHVKKLYQLPDKFILFVGNLKPHKNLKGLLSAFRLFLEKAQQTCSLVIVGKKEGFIRGEKIEDLIQSDPLLAARVKVVGSVEESHLPSFYRLATASILPSFYEGFGLPPLESMSCGCPAIVSKEASLPEICGSAAEYVDAFSPEDIARGIERVVGDANYRRHLIAQGAERCAAFSWTKCAQDHLGWIEELLKG